MQLLYEIASLIHFCVTLRTADLDILSGMQLLCERASLIYIVLLIHFGVTLSFVSELCSCTLVLLPALPIWVCHPVYSCFVSERSYTLVLLSALPIWISCLWTRSGPMVQHYCYGDPDFPSVKAQGLGIYHPVCSCFVSELCSYTLVLLSAISIRVCHPVYSCYVTKLKLFGVIFSTANLDFPSSLQ